MKKWMALLAAVCMLLSCLSAFAETASGVYTFHEQINPFLAIDWTVTLNEDGSYVIEFTKPTGVTYAYTGTWEQKPDGTVVTGTPNESTADIEADFFRDDFSAVWLIDGVTIVLKNDGAGSAGANAPVGGFAGAMGSRENPGHPVSDVLPDALAGRTFAYDEVVAAFGFTVHWTLTFDGENTAILISPNDVMGDSVYACSWAFDDGLIVTRIEEVVKGQAPLADFFDAHNGFECRWVLTDADSSMMPLSLDDSNAAVPAQSGLPGNQGAAAAYAASPDHLDRRN